MTAADNLRQWALARRILADPDLRNDDPEEAAAIGRNVLKQAFPALLEFADAVLALHRREGEFCAVCIDVYEGQHEYPCPTVRLAEQHLRGAS